MNSPAEASPEREVVWPVGNEPTLRLRGPGPPPIRRGLVLGAAAALGVLTGVVTTWADTSPVGPTPDTPQWIAPGADDRLSDVRPRTAADAPSPAPARLAQAKMSELTVVPLSRRTTPSHSATADPLSTDRLRPNAPAPLRSESGEDARESAEEEREPTPKATTPRATAPKGNDPKAKDPKAKEPRTPRPRRRRR